MSDPSARMKQGLARRRRQPRAIDLFSGCGGLTLGLKRAGFEVVGAVDSEPLAVETYQANHREVRVWATDIRKLSASLVMERLRLSKGKLDLLAGCPPCQGFSSVRTLNGKRKVRSKANNLIFEFLRFVRVLRPKAIMLENVPGLGSNWRFRAFRLQLTQLGYKHDHRVLDASDFGVPQRRRRLILIATLSGDPKFADVDPLRPTVRTAIAGLPSPGRSGDQCHDHSEKRADRVLSLIKRIPKNGGSRASLGESRQLTCHRRTDGFHDVYGRMKWSSVAPTITGGCVNPSKGRFLHPSQDRAITLREAALLQTFPCRYFFSLERGKFAAAEMIGNALPPEFVRRHAVEVRRVLRGVSRKAL